MQEGKFIRHVVGAAKFYDDLAVKTLGRSPKHVMLLHEMDATVLFLEPLVKTLRAEGWKIISLQDAFEDPMYREAPKNLYANNGIVAQLALEKTVGRVFYNDFESTRAELDQILGL